MRCLAALVLVLAGCGATHPVSLLKGQSSWQGLLPNPTLTPGTLCTSSDPNFDGFRYAEHIAHCRRHVTEDMKAEIARNYGVDRADFDHYEFDHYIPLSIGGSSNIDNIWPEPHPSSFDKDQLEEQVFENLRDGKITQADAIAQIRAWHP